jgi:hypothetical protein
MSSFKTRLLIALFLIIAVTWAYPETGQQDGLIHSLLSYATNTDYDVSRWLESIWYDQELSPASSTSALRLPCSYTEVVRHFGWYYNARTGDQSIIAAYQTVINIEHYQHQDNADGQGNQLFLQVIKGGTRFYAAAGAGKYYQAKNNQHCKCRNKRLINNL